MSSWLQARRIHCNRWPQCHPGVRFDVCRRLCAQGLVAMGGQRRSYARAEFVLTRLWAQRARLIEGYFRYDRWNFTWHISAPWCLYLSHCIAPFTGTSVFSSSARAGSTSDRILSVLSDVEWCLSGRYRNFTGFGENAVRCCFGERFLGGKVEKRWPHPIPKGQKLKLWRLVK